MKAERERKNDGIVKKLHVWIEMTRKEEEEDNTDKIKKKIDAKECKEKSDHQKNVHNLLTLQAAVLILEV